MLRHFDKWKETNANWSPSTNVLNRRVHNRAAIVSNTFRRFTLLPGSESPLVEIDFTFVRSLPHTLERNDFDSAIAIRSRFCPA